MYKMWWPLANVKADLHNLKAHTKFGDNAFIFTQSIAMKRITDMSGADKSVKNWQTLPIGNPKPDLYNINAYSKFSKTQYWHLLAIVR